jgi:hypothetical protein
VVAGPDLVHRFVEGIGHVDVEPIGKNENPPERFRKLVLQLCGGVAVNVPGAFVSQQQPADVPDVSSWSDQTFPFRRCSRIS